MKISTFIVTILLTGLGYSTVGASVIVAPNAFENGFGPANNCVPFGCSTPRRYQQLYRRSQFTALSSPSEITHIAFRPAEGGLGLMQATFQNVEVTLSTNTSGALAVAFDDNVGLDEQIVYSGALAFSGVSPAAPFPPVASIPFAFLIKLQNPFAYDPVLGDLLLSFDNLAGDVVSSLLLMDSINASPTTSQRLVGAAGAPTGTTLDNRGLVTQFTFRPVATPEPSTMLLCLMGALTCLRRRVRV